LARGDAGPGSDVDLLAEIEPGCGFSLLDLVGLQHELGDLTGRKVEIGTAVERMRPRVRARVEADAVEVF
jgi:predicted nucleotidyltransferase